jgi:ribosomal protein L18
MKTLTMLTLVGTLAIAVPAIADGTSADAGTTVPSAQQQCRTERSGMGRDAFALLYGTNKNRSNAFGKCVSKRAKKTDQAATEAKTNASKECTAEEAADPAAFAAKYGTGKKGANAHGKCVSQLAKSKTADTVSSQVKADVTAAKACKAERKADPKAFAEKYGTNKNKANAFGKCVAKQAKA